MHDDPVYETARLRAGTRIVFWPPAQLAAHRREDDRRRPGLTLEARKPRQAATYATSSRARNSPLSSDERSHRSGIRPFKRGPRGRGTFRKRLGRHDVTRRFYGSSGLGSWFGNEPSGVRKERSTRYRGKCGQPVEQRAGAGARHPVSARRSITNLQPGRKAIQTVRGKREHAVGGP